MFTSISELLGDAQTNRKRVAEHADLDEGDRNQSLELWDSAISNAGAGLAMIKKIQTRLQTFAQRCRQKKAGLAEIWLAGKYNDITKAVNAWLTEVEAAVRDMHEQLDSIGKAPGA